MKAWKLFLTALLCCGLPFGYGLLGCGDDDGENGRDVGCTVNADCDDGLFCNGAETCVDNLCQAGTPEDCEDGVACTVDSCNEDTDGCDNTPDDGECDDGLFCNGAETCDALEGCEGAVDPCPDPLGCDEENDQCTGCIDDADCDDDLFCNGAETCIDNVCQAGTPEDCDDGVSCTVDSCNEDTDGCDNTPDDGECDDGLFCNGTETCDAVMDCEAGVDPCPDPADCDEENDRCDVGPALIPAALLSVASGCETYIGAHPNTNYPAEVVEYLFCSNGDAEKAWDPDPGSALVPFARGFGTWSVDPVTNELTIVTTSVASGVTSVTTEVYDTAFTYDGGTMLDLNSAAQVPAGDGTSVVGNYERHSSIEVVTSGFYGAFDATIDSTADTAMTVTEAAWEATLVQDNECSGAAAVCNSVPQDATIPTSGTFTMPGELYEFDGTYIFQVDDTLVLERQ